jgi:hypothetical protein
MKVNLNLSELFDMTYADEYIKFDRIENKFSKRADIHAFILLDSIISSDTWGDIIAAAEHDQVWLNVNSDELAEKATPEQIRDLIRCGVSYDKDIECLTMFV